MEELWEIYNDFTNVLSWVISFIKYSKYYLLITVYYYYSFFYNIYYLIIYK
jgi:hypothetical protein